MHREYGFPNIGERMGIGSKLKTLPQDGVPGGRRLDFSAISLRVATVTSRGRRMPCKDSQVFSSWKRCA